MNTNLSKLFYPQTTAIIGASSKEKSIGYELTKTILNYGYKGDLYLTNPKSDSILGVKCYKNISDIPKPIDLAIVIVPKAFVEESIDKLIETKVGAIILITAGFKETGSEGAIVEERIKEKIKNANIRMVGPNCMGAINTLSNIMLNATFVAERPETGKTAFASQSGALGAAVLNSLRLTDIKFAHFISVGNKADINENDLLDYWMTDNNIETIALYLESFEDGFGFINRAINNKFTKPIITLKAGKTSSGSKAASSHTGALNSSDKIVNSVLNQFGIIRVDNLNDLFNTAKGFENFPLPKGNKVAVLTNAGGPAILCVDSLEQNNLKLADLNEGTKTKLKQIVHPEGSVNNPVDLLPGGTAEMYAESAKLLLQDDNVDSVISIFVEPVMVQPLPVVEAINGIESDKPIMQIVMPLPEFWNNYKSNSISKKPLFKNPEDVSPIIKNMNIFSNNKNQIVYNSQRVKLLNNYSRNIFNNSSGYISAEDTNKILKHYNIPIVDETVIEAEEYTKYKPNKFPIVVKGINKKFTHKSDIGGVILNIKDYDEYLSACVTIISNFRKRNVEVNQFLIQPFIQTKYELLIGGIKDKSFGPTISFGLGGKYVELFNDITTKSAFVCEEDVLDMINSTRAGKLLAGLRGEKKIDIQPLIKIINNCAKMITENSNIEEFDINPLIVTKENQYFTIDSRIKFN